MVSEFQIEPVDWLKHSEALISIRTDVFIREQNVSERDEIDGLDPECWHLLCRRSVTGEPVGCARMTKSGKIGRVAVLPAFRRQGLGAEIVRLAVKTLVDSGQSPYLDAQVSAIGFYERLGFYPVGDEFMDANIPHRRMRFKEADSVSEDGDNSNSDPIRAASKAEKIEQFEQHFDELLSSSNSDVFILCPKGSLPWLCAENNLSSLRRRLIGQSSVAVQLLIDEKQPELAQIAPLLHLARKLPSKLLIRCINDDSVQFDQLVMFDRAQKLAVGVDNKEAGPEYCELTRLHPNKAQIERDAFSQIWEHQTWNNPYLREINI